MSIDVSRRQAGVLHWAGRWPEAAEAWRRVLATDPTDGGAWLMLGMVLVRLEQPTEAMEALRRGLLLHPELTTAWRQLAALAADLHDHETEADAWLALGQQADERGESVEALAAYSRVVALKPDLAPARHRLAELQAALGHLDAAISELQQLAAEETGRGDRAAAERTLEVLLRIDPANTWAKRRVLAASGAIAAIARARSRSRIGAGDRRSPPAPPLNSDDAPWGRALALRQGGKLAEAARFLIDWLARAEAEAASAELLAEAAALLRLLPPREVALAVELAAVAQRVATRRGEGDLARRLREAARASLGRAVADDPEDLLRLAPRERAAAVLALREIEAELTAGRREAAFDLLLAFLGERGDLIPAHRLLSEVLEALGAGERAKEHGRALATLRRLRGAPAPRAAPAHEPCSPSPASDG